MKKRIDGFEPWKSVRARSNRIDLDPRERWLLRNVLRGCLVLDVGCGDGLLTEQFRAVGVEYARGRCRRAKKRVPVVRGDACHLMFRDNTFDCIVLSEVIEHLEMPFLALREAWRVLKMDGFLLITTPNYASIGWSLSREKTHIVGFTPRLLTNALERLGFRVEECGTDKFNPFSFLGPKGRPYWLTQTLARTILGNWGSQICCKVRKVRKG